MCDFHSRYSIVKYLGKGASGHVYLVTKNESAELYAVKFIERGARVSKYTQTEILNHRTLLHHHVVQFKEVCMTDSHLCIVMEYCAGGDLLSYMRRRREGISEACARWLFQQLVLAMDYCHKMGLSNRDIKLDNLLLSDDGEFPILKICDFGFSKDEDRSIAMSDVGTPVYRAPETFKSFGNRHYDGKMADIWSAGIVLYVLLFQKYPFFVSAEAYPSPMRRQLAIANKIIDEELKIPETPIVCPYAENLLARILTKNPKQRISVEDIKVHPWFQMNLPAGALEMNDKFQKQTQGLQDVAEILYLMEKAATRTTALTSLFIG